MTDGIIQEVFKRYYSRKFPDGFNDRIFYQIQQELIEKVKQKRVWQWDAVRLRDLIGDNQE